jgi:antitoxin component YwqK of YwqJK toxin-antitoxin module
MMKILFALTLLFPFTLFSQTSFQKNPNNLNEIIVHSVSIEYSTLSGKSLYKVNDSIVTEEVYKRYDKEWKSFTDCQPCWIKQYSINERLEAEYEAWQDCAMGVYFEYYPGGNIKAYGMFKRIKDECRIRDGKWIFYKENGEVEKTEVYKNGKLKK